MPVTAGLAISAGIGGYQAIKGGMDAQKLQNQLNANVMPKYTIPQTEYQNLNLAESMAGQGMSAASREAYNQNAQAGLGSSIEALERSGASPETLGTAYAGYNSGERNLAIYDDQARLRNLKELSDARARMTADQDKQWQINAYAPWANKAKALAEQIAGAKTMENAGFNALAGAGTSLASGGIGKGTGGDRTTTPAVTTPSITPSTPAMDGSGLTNNASSLGAWSFPSYSGGSQPPLGNFDFSSMAGPMSTPENKYSLSSVLGI